MSIPERLKPCGYLWIAFFAGRLQFEKLPLNEVDSR